MNPRRDTRAKPAAFYVPIQFDAAELPPELRDYARYVLNQLHWRRVCWRADADGFVRLRWLYLTRIIPRPMWPEIRRRLTDDDRPGGPVVERDRHTVWGRKAEGYRLAPAYQQVHRVVCTNEALNQKIRDLAATRDATRLPVHRWLHGHLEHIEFDWDRAQSILPTLRPDPGPKRLSRDEYQLRIFGQCQRLADGERPLVCDRFGRVHTPITSLPRALRPCLSVDGRPLVGLDLANSQPLVAGLLARRFTRSKDTQFRLRQATFDEGADPYRRAALVGLAARADEPRDLAEYLRCCADGQFYEAFVAPGRNRERCKSGFMSILMGPNRYKSPVKTAFENRFPTVAGMLRALKGKEYARAAWLLQNHEALIFIHEICGQLMTEYPDLPVYTIHDSLFTTRDGLDAVRGTIFDQFGRFEIRPLLKPC